MTYPDLDLDLSTVCGPRSMSTISKKNKTKSTKKTIQDFNSRSNEKLAKSDAPIFQE